jgi:hypothetical protein
MYQPWANIASDDASMKSALKALCLEAESGDLNLMD